MFQITQNVIEKTESYILGFSVADKSRLWSFILRVFYFPVHYLILGVREVFKPASIIWFVSTLVFYLLSAFIIKNFETTKDISAGLIAISTYFPMILVIFAVPSTYAYYGINKKQVEKVVGFLESNNLNSIEKVKLLEENIERIHTRILSRISFYKWLVGSIWTIVIIVINIQIRIVSLSEQNIDKVLSEGTTPFLIMFLITLLALLLIIGYKRASEFLIKSIEFACTDLKYKLESKKVEVNI